MSAHSRCVPSRRDPHRATSETGRWGAGGGAELIRSHGEGLCPAPRSQAVPKPPGEMPAMVALTQGGSLGERGGLGLVALSSKRRRHLS